MRNGIGNGGYQDWGHVRVRQGARLFWWLHLSTADNNNSNSNNTNTGTFIDPLKRPLAIWLQGGPGASATGYGNFAEIGPLDIHLRPRPYTWINNMHVLFVDAPVGTGFSYADTPADFSRTDTECAEDLMALIAGFYAEHPEFHAVPVHIFAESYGGKLAMEWALLWRRAKTAAARNLPRTLRSVTSVDGWIAPVASMKAWAPLLLSTGLVEPVGAERIAAAATKAEQLCDAGKWTEAMYQWGQTESVVSVEADGVDFYNIMNDQFMYADNYANEDEVVNATGRRSSRLIREGDNDVVDVVFLKELMFTLLVQRTQSRRVMDATREAVDEDYLLHELMNGPVHKALNISTSIVWGAQSSDTFFGMRNAFMRSAISTVEALLEMEDNSDNDNNGWSDGGIRVNILSGQLDLIVATAGTVDWLHQLRWPGSEAFKQAPRERLITPQSGRVEGWIKQHGRLSYYMMKRAGHMVPADNPDGMDVLLRRVTKYDQV